MLDKTHRGREPVLRGQILEPRDENRSVPAVGGELGDRGRDVDEGRGLGNRHVLSLLTGGLREPDETGGLEAVARPRVVRMNPGNAKAARLAPEEIPEQLEHALRFRLPYEA